MELRAISGCLIIIVLSIVAADKTCLVGNSELQKLQETLHNIDQTIYSLVDDKNDDSECRKTLKQINIRLKQLSQRYKLMNKGYVTQKEQQEMMEDYKKQVAGLESEIAKLKDQLEGDKRGIIDNLKAEIEKLTNEASMLRSQLSAIQQKVDDVKKQLCIRYLASKNLDKAIHHLKSMRSHHLMDMIQLTYDERKKSNFATLILFIDAYPDLDDRAEAFLRLLNRTMMNFDTDYADFVLMETKVLRLVDSIEKKISITEEKAEQLKGKLSWFASMSYNAFQVWATGLRNGIPHELKVNFEMLHRKQVEHIETLLHYNFLKENDSLVKFDMIRNFVRLLGMTHGINKYKGSELLLKRNISYTLMSIMSIGMDDIFSTSMDIKDSMKSIMGQMPDSLKNIEHCLNAVKVVQKNRERCIQLTNYNTQQFKNIGNENLIGHFNRTVVTSQKQACTVFRIIPTPDMMFVELKTSEGVAFSAIDSFTPGIVSYTSYVGTNQVPLPGFKSQTDSRWLIEPNYTNETVKITSEFKVYIHLRTRDYLITENINSSPTVVLQRYGYHQVYFGGRANLADWILKCSDEKVK
ncbi:uncharacterized protein LOC129737923 [Uranotaenia lowii]|uniref:uncharacterized protein LOC129737923 n=1 Tax=Uranotaenia lowii TaxID=190385 RepID=UPI002478660E|nr:uncharacterized protein LOC129737923 [Uranotaenia lowii]